VHPYAAMTMIYTLSSAMHASIFGLTDGWMVLATAATVESCAAVTPAKTMNVTIFTLMRYSQMMMATETETLALGMELTSRMI
jgi:hypothetical protein